MAKKNDNPFLERYGEWALIAGAAEGVGAGFSEILAQKGMNLVMADVRETPLHELADKLRTSQGIQVIEIRQDLSEENAAENCLNRIKEVDCRLLVYVPAYSRVKSFYHHSHEELDKYIDLNARTPLQIVHAFVNHLKGSHKGGGIILMSSLAGITGSKYISPYAATKAFNILLSTSLFFELKEKGVDILACCAGPTDTPGLRSSEPQMKGSWPGVSDPLDVARHAVKNLGRKPVCIPGWKNRFSSFILTRFLSRKQAVKIVCDSMEKIYPVNP